MLQHEDCNAKTQAALSVLTRLLAVLHGCLMRHGTIRKVVRHCREPILADLHCRRQKEVHLKYLRQMSHSLKDLYVHHTCTGMLRLVCLPMNRCLQSWHILGKLRIAHRRFKTKEGGELLQQRS